VIAAGLLFLHLIVVAIRSVELDPTDPNSAFRATLEFWWVLWLGLPFLVGCAAVAEERKLGTLEGQLCLPMARGAQFTVKLGVALLLGIFLGGVMPWVAKGVGGFDAVPGAFREARRAIPSRWQPLALTCLIAAGITLVSFYASTLRRSLLHAMGTAVIFGFALMAIGGWAIAAAIDPRNPPPWGTPLIIYVGGPLMLAALFWLGLKNYAHVETGWRLAVRNLLVIIVTLAFAFTVTAVVYRRSWERFMTLEPSHGPARLSGSVRPKICSTTGRKLFVLLPDGRLWAAGQYEIKELDEYVETHRIDRGAPTIRREKARIPVPVDGVFIGTSKWIALASTSTRVVGIQSDGSLWRIFSQPTFGWHLRACPKIARGPAARDFGCGQGGEVRASPTRAVRTEPTQATDKRPAARRVFAPKAAWLRCSSVEDPGRIFSFVAPRHPAFGAKTGPRGIFGHALRSLSLIPEPERIGTDVVWKTVVGGHGHFLALKKDGSV